MIQQQPIPSCPGTGASNAYKVMEDAAVFYLKHGGPEKAREHIDRLAGYLMFYPDCGEAYISVISYIEEQEKEARRRAEENEQMLPSSLRTDKAMRLWQALQQAGYVDDAYQPLNLSRTQTAVLAHEIGKRLRLKPKWPLFESFWGRNNMRSDYSAAMGQCKITEFLDELKNQLSDVQ